MGVAGKSRMAPKADPNKATMCAFSRKRLPSGALIGLDTMAALSLALSDTGKKFFLPSTTTGSTFC